MIITPQNTEVVVRNMRADGQQSRADYLEAMQEQLARLTRAAELLDTLFDAHYGAAVHHCGDGDGLSKDEAAQIVEFVMLWRKEKQL